jgi:hypothetical protein
MKQKLFIIILEACFIFWGSLVFGQSGTVPATISMWNRGVFNLYESGGSTTSVGPDWWAMQIRKGRTMASQYIMRHKM